mmetsp:Transcript_38601/g.123735  ORF Transcript_38601/g.123735 Transcript_38601/m.123735 type:complete len:228 (+) Transcript_38601:240-923(+)
MLVRLGGGAVGDRGARQVRRHQGPPLRGAKASAELDDERDLRRPRPHARRPGVHGRADGVRRRRPGPGAHEAAPSLRLFLQRAVRTVRVRLPEEEDPRPPEECDGDSNAAGDALRASLRLGRSPRVRRLGAHRPRAAFDFRPGRREPSQTRPRRNAVGLHAHGHLRHLRKGHRQAPPPRLRISERDGALIFPPHGHGQRRRLRPVTPGRRRPPQEGRTSLRVPRRRV